MKKRFLPALASLLFLAMAACLRVGGGSPTGERVGAVGPRGNGEGFLGVIAVAGNAHPRCGFEVDKADTSRVNVVCRVVVRGEDGVEKEATEIAAGTKLTWFDPIQLSGPQIANISCRVESSGTTNICDVQLGLEDSIVEPTRIEFALQAHNDKLTPAPEKTVVAIVSASTFGLAPQMPAFNAIASKDELPNGKPAGLDPGSFNPLETSFGTVSSICISGSGENQKVYFAAGIYIFVEQKGVAKLYAGSSIPANRNNFESRFTPFMFSYGTLYLNCLADGRLLVSEMGSTPRIYLISETGPVVALPNGPYRVTNSVQDASGNVYFNPGKIPGYDTGVIVKYDATFKTKTNIPTPGYDLSSESSLAVVGHFLYVAQYALHRIFRVDLRDGSVVPYAGTGTSGYTGDGGPALEAQIGRPTGLVADAQGTLYFSQQANARIRKISSTGIISTILGNEGTWEDCKAMYVPNSDCLFGPMALSATGTLYMASRSYRVRTLSTITGAIGDFVMSAAEYARVEEAEAPLAKAIFYGARSIAFHQGNIVVGDSFGLRSIHPGAKVIRKLPKAYGTGGVFGLRSISGGRLVVTHYSRTTIANPDGTTQVLSPNGATDGVFAADGAYYYLTWPGNAIIKINPTTKQEELFAGSTAPAGPRGGGFSGDGGLAIEARMGSQGGIDVGPDNALYFCDKFAGRVRRIDLATNIITSIAGGGVNAVTEGAWADSVSLRFPLALRVAKNGDIYVADTEAPALRVLRPVPQADGSVRYKISTLVGRSTPASGCAAQVHDGVFDGQDLFKRLKASLEVFCIAQPLNIDILETEQETQLAYIQSFHGTTNVALLSIPKLK